MKLVYSCNENIYGTIDLISRKKLRSLIHVPEKWSVEKKLENKWR